MKFMAGVFDSSTVSRIQQANDIVDVIAEYVSLKKKGREMVGLCPFHDDHKPSLYVNPVKQIFKCFACSAGGDVFKFLQMFENLTFPQAIERLAERAGIKIERRQQPDDKAKAPPDVDPNRLAKANAWAADYFQKNLLDKKKGEFARDYLEKRKIPLDVAKDWQIGLAVIDDDLAKTAKQKKASIDLLIKAGLLTSPNSDRFVNRLMFTITDVTGRVIGFGGRAFEQAEAKYINSPATALFDKSNCLYGLQQARHSIVSSGTSVVVEGYTDCIMAHYKGISNVVASLGTSFTAGQARILRRFAKKAVLVFDSDIAGTEAANRALEVCVSQHIDIKIACIPGHKDPCDFLLSAGREKFEQLINSAVDVFTFKWDRLTQSLGKNDTIVERKAAVDEFLQTIANAMQAGSLDPIEKGLIVNHLASIIGLEAKQINNLLATLLKRVERAAAYQSQEQKFGSADLGQGGFAVAQRQVIEVLLNRADLFKSIKNRISPELFDVPVLRQIAQILFKLLKKKTKITLADILAETDSVELANVIVELERQGGEKGNFESSLDDAVEAMHRFSQKQKRAEIKEIKDKTEYLKQAYEDSRKQNGHNIGMI
jgi:DNA primase